MSTWNDDDNTTLDGLSDDSAEGAAPARPAENERYRVGETLGVGGMGEVKAALDRKLRREVALKVLSAESPGGRDRFYAEAQVTAQLEHPNIVPVHDIGTTREGRPFLAMKRVRGAALSERAQSLSLEGRLEVFRKVCDAVAFAHARGVLHRDIKPENVMVGEFGEVLLMDWGLARPAEGGSSLGVDRFEEDSRRTRHGQVAGTPAFMAPEQAEGRSDRVGERTDVYGLGALLYTLLVSAPPFSGASSDVLEAVRRGTFLPPRARKAELPRELDAVVMRAMAKTPEDRYPSVMALREDIDAWLAHQPLVHVRSSVLERATKWALRHRAAVRSGGMVGILALAGLLLGLWRYVSDVGEARDQALAEAARAREAEAAALQGLIHAKVSLADALSARGLLGEAGNRLAEAAALAEGRAVDRRALELARSVYTVDSPPPISRCHPHGEHAARALSLSDDGARALSWGGDGRVVEWNTATCAEISSIQLPELVTSGAVLLEGGEARFAVVSDGALRLGSLQDGLAAPVPVSGRVWRILMGDDLVTLGFANGGATRVSGGVLVPLTKLARGHWISDPYSGLRLAVSAGAVAEMGGVWPQDADTPLFEQIGLNDVAVTRAGSLALHATSAGYGAVDLGSARPLWDHPGRPMVRVGLSADDSVGWVLGFDHAVELFDPRTGALIGRFSGPERVHAVGLSANGRVLSLADAGGEVATFLRPRVPPRRFAITTSAAQGIDVGGSWLVVSDDTGVVRRVDIATGALAWTGPIYTDGARQVAVSPDGRRIAVALREQGVAVLDANTGAELARLPTPSRTVSVAWLDDARLATVPVDGSLIVLDPASGATWNWGKIIGGPSWDLTPMGQSRVLVATHLDNGAERAVIDADGRDVWRQAADVAAYQHAVSPDGSLVAIARHDGQVELRDAGDGRELRRLTCDGGPTMAVAFSPDGALLATGGFSERVMLWDVATGELLRSEKQHTGPVLNLIFSPDGASVLSVGLDGGVAVLPLGAHTAHAVAVAGLRGDPRAQARALAALGWWERVPDALDAAMAAGFGDDPALREQAAWVLE